MTETKIRPSDPEFQRATARGDRQTIEQWIAEDRIEWHPSNTVGQQLAEEARARLKAEEAAEEAGEEAPRPQSRVDRLIGEAERLSHSHPVVQGAIARGDSQLLAELMGHEKYEPSTGTGWGNSFTWADIENRHRDAS